jgi:exopolysaccharide biosynthesis polyprenyl glycosylphosphotransferase
LSLPASDTQPPDETTLERRPPRRFLRPSSRSIYEAPGPPAARARDRRVRRSLVVADAAAAAFALVIGVAVLGDDALRPVAALFIPLAVIVSKVIGLYDRDEPLLHKTTLDDVPALLQVATTYTLLVWWLAPVLLDGTLGRGQALGLWCLLLVGGVGARLIAREFARRSAPAERCLLVADATALRQLIHRLVEGPNLNVEIVGCMEIGDAHDLASVLGRIEQTIKADEIHRVILAPRALDGDAVLDTMQRSKALGAKISLLPRMFEVVGSSVEFDDIGGMTMLGLRRFGLTRSSWVLKRSLDWIGASMLVFCTAPLLALIALAIRLEGGGPVLFRQVRVGRDGQRFNMYKFRTMVDGADALKAELLDRNEADGLFKIADDPRVTRVGRLLRRRSLDELPQLVNVLRGEMSLVGPRPLVIEEDRKVVGWHRRRLQLTPGMTGHWQILGSARIPLGEMVKIDYLYVVNWSLWSDIKILLRTIPYLLRAKGL